MVKMTNHDSGTHFASGHAAVDDDQDQRQDNNDDKHGPEPRTLVSSIDHRLNKAALQPTHVTTKSSHVI